MSKKKITREQVYKARSEKELQSLIFEVTDSRLGFIPIIPYSFVSEETELLIGLVISYLPKKVLDFVANHVAFYENHEDAPGQGSYSAICFQKQQDNIKHFIVFDSMLRYSSLDFKCYIIAHEIGHAWHGNIEVEKEAEEEADEFAAKYGFAAPARHSRFRIFLKAWQFDTSLLNKILTIILALIVICSFSYLAFSY